MRNRHGKPIKKEDPTIDAAGGLTHMAREPSERRDEMTEPSGPDYPGGLQLHLDHGDLEKLGHHEHSHEAGHEVHVHGKGHISHVTSEERDGKKEQRLSIQLTHIGIHHPADGFKDEEKEPKHGASPNRKRH